MPQTKFALAPGRITDHIIDYSTTEGMQHYHKATKPLKKHFDGRAENIHHFLNQVSDRSKEYGWEDITHIKNSEGKEIDVIKEYGQYTLADIKSEETSWHGTRNKTRSAQNSYLMFRFLRDSLEAEFHSKITLSESSYTVNGEEDGPSLFKVIIMKSQVDTVATISHIREKLSKLDYKMAEVKQDIVMFNDYVQKQMAALNARGQTSNDIFINVLKGYRTVEDQNFKAYIESKNNIYEENGLLTVEELMLFAENKYKALVQRGEWLSLTNEKKEIISLKAQLIQMSKFNNKNPNKSSNKEKNRKI